MQASLITPVGHVPRVTGTRQELLWTRCVLGELHCTQRSGHIAGRVPHPADTKRLTTMTTPAHRRRFTRAGALTASVAIIASAGLGWHALSASAAFSGQPYETQFEIDGNTAVDGGQDWASDPAGAPNLHDFHQSSELCGGTDKDPNRVVPGTKINDNGLLISSPPVQAGNVNTKSDLCSVYQASELVFVPTADSNDDPQAGQY